YRSTSITCSLNEYTPGVQGPMSIENFKKINEAYQILQTALKQGLPALNNSSGKVDVTYTYTCSGEGNNNCDALKDNRNGGTKTETQIIDGKSVSTTISSKVVDSGAQGNTTGVSYTEITNALSGVPDSAQALLAQASTLINTINEACPWFNATSSSSPNAPQWKWSPHSGGLCGAFKEEISAIHKMITDAQDLVNQTSVITSNEQSAQVGANNNGKPFNPFTDASF
ncbi:SabA family sialic acid-binding adhesin, partial [Helicobacter pylori]|uniref:SabA family sialic acid-binding adhesin n=1 Tax=Helicobacter pylori TaxID=210 RepID=UPI0002BB5C9D